MPEHYKPENELASAYGNEQEVIQEEIADSIDQDFELEEQTEIDPVFEAELYIESIPSEEREILEGITAKQSEIVELINSENIIESEDAAISVLGSAFAGAPSSEDEKNNLPAWKRVLSGASRGAKVATLAIAMSLPFAAGAQNAEDPAITHIVNEIFGKSLYERMSGRRAAEKARYAEIERQKRELVNQLGNTNNIAPRSEAERSAFKLLELRRDRKLAEINEQYVKFTKELMNSDLNDPQTIAYIEKKEALFKELRQKVINSFEEDIRREFGGRLNSSNEEDIRRRIRDIENEQRRLSEREIYRHNRTYYY